jgi:hypothetical protein
MILNIPEVLCIPPKANKDLIGKVAEYTPAGWKFPLDVLITKISGHGTCRDVEIECYVTMEDRLANGIERGTLLFWDDINAELRFDQQALRQGPVRHIGQGTPEVNQWDVDT